MGSSVSSPLPTPLRTALAARADPTGFIRFDAFVAEALYHPTEGYYRRARTRVGRSRDTDFFTATSLGPIFGELVVASCLPQLRGHDPAHFTFIEYGAESAHSALDGVPHPFAAVRTVGIGDEDSEVSGRCIVFSNELFDAQPFRRFLGTGTGWEERGVELTLTGLREALRPVEQAPPPLPPTGPVGYQLDLPTAASALAQAIADQPWSGLFLAFDYGKSWTELINETPHGTARAYRRHQQSNDLIANAGEQDLTCHVDWDGLRGVLQSARFAVEPVLSQEAYLVKHAASALARVMAEEAGGRSSRKAGLTQLLHPAALGQKFQVLSAWRDES